jgi:heme-binding protein
MKTMKRVPTFWRLAGGGFLALLAMQLVPYGRSHVNPPITGEPAWDSPETRTLAKRACFDCHSNETEWPAYSHVAPVSWLVQHDVDEGREVLNFSEWQRPQKEASESAEEVTEGEMPPIMYRLVHSHARLTGAERERFTRGLTKTFGVARQPSRR